MTQPDLRGGGLVLRAAAPEDADTWRAHPRDPGIVRMFGGNPATIAPKTADQAAQWLAMMRSSPHHWVIDREGPIGEIRLHSVDQTDRRARLAVGFFAPDNLGRGYGRAAIGLVLAHAFARTDAGGLGLNRVDLRVLAFNERAIRCYRACGFIEEGRERQAACIAGYFHDDVIMGILAAEFRKDTRA